MALEFLIRNADGKGNRKKGDIVAMKPYPNNGWGAKEGPPNYSIIRVTDKDYSDYKDYSKRHYPIRWDGEGRPTKYKRCLKKLAVDKCSKKIKDDIIQNGLAVATDSEIVSNIEDQDEDEN